MKYLVTFIWALILTQMVNFVLNSLNGGGSLDVIKPIIAIIITIAIAILSAMIKPNDFARKGNRDV